MTNDDKLDIIFGWLVEDCKSDLVVVGQDDAGVYFIEVWSADHKAFELRFSREWMDQLSVDDIAKRVHSMYQRTRAFKLPEWAG